MKTSLLFFAVATAAAIIIGFKITSSPSEPATAAVEQSRGTRTLTYVYPDASPHADAYRRYFAELKERRRFFAIQIVPASAADTIAQHSSLFVLGTPQSNPFLAALLPELPVSFAENSFSLNGSIYEQNEDVVVLAIPHPHEPARWLNIVSGNDDAHIVAFLRQNGRRLQRYGDFSVLRRDQVLAYGFFEQRGGELAVRTERHFIRDKKRIYTDDFFTVDYIGEPPEESELHAFLTQQKELAQRQMHQLDFKNNRKVLPIHLVLYDSAERKTIATGNSRLSSWQPGESSIHLVFNSALRGSDFTAIAEYLCWHWAGDIPNQNVRHAAGILFSHEWGSEGYPVWAGRLFFNGFFVPFAQLFSNDPVEQVSPYIAGPALATFLQFILFHDGAGSLQALLRNTPATLTEAEIDQRFPPKLQQTWQSWCENMLQNSSPPAIAGSADFQKGFCYAHEGYSVYNGYMGTTSAASLARLATLGVNTISITPFGYPRSTTTAAPIRRSFGTGSENDESVIVAAHFAREHGMQIMLKPHLWAGRTWPGDIDMAGEQEWQAFFRHYARWISHYAVLAQMCRFEHLVIGVELVRATAGREAEWRRLIARLRKVYAGKLIYAANWGEEFENVTFWDALDAIGVNCYYPLSKSESPQPGDLQQGARKNMRIIESVAQKYDKPVIITEIGFASRPAPWIAPHVDGRGQPPDLQAQQKSYRAVVAALKGQPWLQGIYWWKWPTDLRDGGPQHSGFTPNQKPAEKVIAEWFLQ